MLASTTGGDRNTVTYTNDTDRSIVTAVTDAKNAVTSYSYDSMRRQTGVTGADGSSVSSVYADDYLTSLSHSGGDSSTTYNFSYGVAGLSTAVKIGETWTLVSNSYNTGAWTLAQQLYGNDLWWKYDYDAQTDDLLRAVYESFGYRRHWLCVYLRFPRADKQDREEISHARKRRDNGRNARDGGVLRL